MILFVLTALASLPDNFEACAQGDAAACAAVWDTTPEGTDRHTRTGLRLIESCRSGNLDMCTAFDDVFGTAKRYALFWEGAALERPCMDGVDDACERLVRQYDTHQVRVDAGLAKRALFEWIDDAPHTAELRYLLSSDLRRDRWLTDACDEEPAACLAALRRAAGETIDGWQAPWHLIAASHPMVVTAGRSGGTLDDDRATAILNTAGASLAQACSTGDRTACIDATQLARTGVRACTKPSSCNTTAQRQLRGLCRDDVSPACDDVSYLRDGGSWDVADMRANCDAGDSWACETAQHLYGPSQDCSDGACWPVHTYAPGPSERRLSEDLTRCDDGDVDSCLRVASRSTAYRDEDVQPTLDRLEVVATACQLGNLRGCEAEAWHLVANGSLLSRTDPVEGAVTEAQGACEQGDLDACHALLIGGHTVDNLVENATDACSFLPFDACAPWLALLQPRDSDRLLAAWTTRRQTACARGDLLVCDAGRSEAQTSEDQDVWTVLPLQRLVDRCEGECPVNVTTVSLLRSRCETTACEQTFATARTTLCDQGASLACPAERSPPRDACDAVTGLDGRPTFRDVETCHPFATQQGWQGRYRGALTRWVQWERAAGSVHDPATCTAAPDRCAYACFEEDDSDACFALAEAKPALAAVQRPMLMAQCEQGSDAACGMAISRFNMRAFAAVRCDSGDALGCLWHASYTDEQADVVAFAASFCSEQTPEACLFAAHHGAQTALSESEAGRAVGNALSASCREGATDACFDVLRGMNNTWDITATELAAHLPGPAPQMDRSVWSHKVAADASTWTLPAELLMQAIPVADRPKDVAVMAVDQGADDVQAKDALCDALDHLCRADPNAPGRCEGKNCLPAAFDAAWQGTLDHPAVVGTQEQCFEDDDPASCDLLIQFWIDMNGPQAQGRARQLACPAGWGQHCHLVD